ncbi:MAG: glycosyltransferase [Muribaculaceae bacterium]|nr:glycosyltransferase [Muribaculaceae bacterium]
MKKLSRILIIGPAPQNIGGISMHIRRLIGLLRKEYDFDFVDEGHKRWGGVFNLRTLNLIKYLGKVFNADIVHIHSGHFLLRLFHVIMCRILMRKYTVVTVHRDPNVEGRVSITRWFLKHCNKVIVVNDNGYKALVVNGCKCQYQMIPAYLPPRLDDEPILPKEIIDKISEIRKDTSGILMVSNAWKLVRHNDQDLYGLDNCIDAMVKLTADKKYYYLIFVIADNTDAGAYLKQYREIIEKNKLESNVVIWESPLSFVRLALESDIVLRTTNTDGDAISIREALDLGKRVIASDVVKRPDGVLLYKTRDVDDLVATIKKSENNDKLAKKCPIDYRQIYLSIYNKNNNN